jgi:FkbM family methyltransferase
MIPDLIYDVGMHNGDDSDYYLRQGFRVVAIEANPILSAAAEVRFAKEIESRRLTLVNAGVSDKAGIQPFWVNKTKTALSSFDEEMASKFGGEVEAVSIQCVPFSEILSQYGVPYFLKIDIEGADHECLDALSRDDLPQYVSAEAHSMYPLCQLRVLGYQEFKCIPQRFHNNPKSGLNGAAIRSRLFSEYLGAVKSDLRGRVEKINTLKRLWGAVHQMRKRKRKSANVGTGNGVGHETVVHASQVEGHGQSMNETFPVGSSGPFGEASFGPWRSFDEVAYDWLHLKIGFPELSSLRSGGWFDFHARRSP